MLVAVGFGLYPTFDNGMAADVWINEEDGQTDYEGEVWPGMRVESKSN